MNEPAKPIEGCKRCGELQALLDEAAKQICRLESDGYVLRRAKAMIGEVGIVELFDRIMGAE
jgi:hypothetical protein